MLLELLAVDLCVHEHAHQIVGRSSPAILDHHPAPLEHLREVFLKDALDPFWAEVLVVGGQRRIDQARPDRVLLLGQAHEAADHPRDDRLGEVADQVAAVSALEPIKDGRHDRPDPLLVVGDALGGEAALEERLDAVVLGRVHADEHGPRVLDREDLGEGGNAADL